jgi:erythromycin esterase-like protein
VDKRYFIQFRSICWLLLFLPLTINAGPREDAPALSLTGVSAEDQSLADLISKSGETFSDIASADLDGLLKRIGDARIVLLGDASHGTHEFYEMRARITRALIEHKGFNLIAIEGDWPDASRVNHFIQDASGTPLYRKEPFTVFPEWMWRNQSFLDFTYWLRQHNRNVTSADDVVGFYGIDVYNLPGSIDVVLDYLYGIDPRIAEYARRQYRCLAPWAEYPPDYGHFLKTGEARRCSRPAEAVLQVLINHRDIYQPLDTERYFTALENAKLVVNGEHYFRIMDEDYASWNLRDTSMFNRLQTIMQHHGPTAKVVVWAHNSHLGDARATDMKELGQINLGQLVREAFGDNAYLIGMGMDHGMVTAASRWGAPVEVKRVPGTHKDSYEYLFHLASAENFLLPLRHVDNPLLRNRLIPKREERAIGTMYDPNNEVDRHYFVASLPHQFDEYIFFDNTHALRPLPGVPMKLQQ